MGPAARPVDGYRSGPGPRDGQGGHPRLPALAGRGGQARQRRRLRHHLCLCRLHHHRRCSSCRRAQQRSDEYGGSAGEPRPPAARADRGHPRSRRPHCAIVGPPHRRRALRTRRPGAWSDEGLAAIELLADLPDLWDILVGDLRTWIRPPSRFAPGERPGALHRLRQEDHQQARGRRRPLHLAGYHGLAGAARHPRHDRRRPPLDRRSLPAEEDRGGPPRRHPRMHRLQHLRLQPLLA